jgi:hypothetical protein
MSTINTNARELLELAAKAAGLKIDKSPDNGGGIGNDGFDMLGNVVLDWHNGVTWNPRTDSGQALELAVRLGIDFSIHRDSPGCFDAFSRACWYADDEAFGECDESHNGDPLAATCLAITRAAAEIGRTAPAGG